MRRRSWARLAASVMVLVLALALITAQALLGDPRPRFERHRSAIVHVESGEPTSAAGHWVQNVSLTSASGLEVQLSVKWPDDSGSVARKRPLLLLLGGHRTGRDAIDLIGDTRGAIIAAVSYPFSGNPRVKGLAIIPEIPAIRGALLDTPPALMLALDHLLTRPDVDSAVVEMVGVSLGAPFVCIAGALDSRVARVWSIHGAGDPLALLDHNLERRIPFGPARSFVARSAYLLINGPHLAPERWVGQISPRPFVMINAEQDERLPRATVERLYASALAPREITWMPGPHVLPRRAELVQRLIDAVLVRVPGTTAAPDEAPEPLLPGRAPASAPSGTAAAGTRAAPLNFDSARLENGLERFDAVVGGFEKEILHHRFSFL